MSHELPPTIDPAAALRWQQAAPAASPWLHEEVARRMQERLDWIVKPPQRWCHWQPVRGGLQAHALLRQRYAQSECLVYEASPAHEAAAREQLGARWWQPARWTGGATHFGEPAPGGVDMLWANMALHQQADPQALITRWHQALSVDGYVMFSCLGPDTLRELHAVYAQLGWPPAGQAFTDMHDWGDMLVHAGFSEPVMDMEHITLSFGSPERLLQELRELGRNLAPGRAPGLRGRGWHAQLLRALAERGARTPQGALRLSFEVIYGHALKPAPRHRLAAETSIPLDAMRTVLRTKPGA
jgi:malonyl-CoA O-methyltransferase